MKYLVSLLSILVALLLCASAFGSSAFQTISPQQGYKLLQEHGDLIFLDIRTPEELSEGYIEGAELMNIWTILKGRHNLPKDKPIMVVCAVGGRSYLAGQVLARSGYREVYNLEGGLSAWKSAGLPVKMPLGSSGR